MGNVPHACPGAGLTTAAPPPGCRVGSALGGPPRAAPPATAAAAAEEKLGEEEEAGADEDAVRSLLRVATAVDLPNSMGWGRGRDVPEPPPPALPTMLARLAQVKKYKITVSARVALAPPGGGGPRCLAHPVQQRLL